MRSKILALPLVAAALTVSVVACSSSGSGGSSAAAGGASSSAGTKVSTSSSFGPGCASVPKSGAGSFSGMASAPVATAASANPLLSTLVSAVKKAGLVSTLNSAKGITVFAPDNAAFAKIPKSMLGSVLSDKAELTKILTYHVAAGRITPAELAAGTPIKTLEGSTVTPAKMGGTYTVNDAQVVCGNVQTANATVYIVSSVLMPPATTAANFGPGCASVPKSGSGSFSGMASAPVATAASANPLLSTLVTAVRKAGLVNTLNSASGITVFAPDNAAFAKIPKATLNKVLSSKAELTKILTYHVAAGRRSPADLASGVPVPTLEGSTVTPAQSGMTFTVNGASVVCGNVQTSNATVYIINKVLMPPSS